MATNIVLKRSATADAVPSTSDLELGEIALNTYDGKIYMKKTVSGSSSIVNLSGSVAPTSSAFSHTTYKFVASGSTTTFTGSDANSTTLAYTAGQIQVFLNGILLDATDYTASNGTSIVLASATGTGNILYVISFEGTNPFDYFKYVATNGQTTFTGNDANSESLLYTVGNIAVYLNGVLLDATDYTGTSGTSVVLASGATTGDILTVWEFNETGLSDLSSDSTPQLGGDLDVNGSDIVSTSNAHINVIPNGTGNVTLQTDTLQLGSSAENVTVTTNSTGDLTLNTNSGTNSGSIVIADGANNNITLTPNGSGNVVLDNHTWPAADGSASQVLQTNGSGVLSFTTISSAAITDADGNTKIQVEEGSNDDTIRFDVGGTEQIVLVDGVLRPTTDNDIDLGTSSLEFKDAFFDGTVTSDAFAGPLTGNVTGDLSGTATLATSVTVSANNSTDETVYPVFVDGATGTQGAESDTGLTYNPSSGTLTSSIFVGALTGTASLSTLAATATALATARTIGGTSFDGTANIAVATATEGTNVTVSANNSTDETVYPTFVDGATGTQGIETDTGLTYNPSSGILTATQFTGNVTGNVTGNTSGTAATVTTAAQTNITSLGTLTTLTVDNVIVNGTTIGHTGDTDLMTLASGVLTVAGDVYVGGSNKELRFYEGSNYVGFEAPALSADQIWVLPTVDGDANQTLKTDGSGTLSWATAASAVSNLTDVTLSSLASNEYLRYNGSAWVNTSQGSNPVVNTMTGDGSDTTLTLTQAPLHENATLLTIDGVVQHKSTYAVSGTTLTFSTAPPSGTAVECITNVNTNILNGNDVAVDTMTGDNSDTTLSLSVTPTNENHVNVYWDGVYQHKDNWSLSGTTITFATAPGTGVKVEAVSNQMMSAGTATDLSASAISGKTLVTAVGADHLLVFDATDSTLKKALISDVIEQATTEEVQDIAGGMFTGNTETGITATYQDGDGTIDLVVGTLNQNTTGSAATLTTARTIGGTSFDGSANIAVGLAGTATALATARTIGGTSFDGTANIAVATATEGTNVTVVANNSTDETVYPTFVDGATGTQGIETDTGLTYNPSTGMLTSTGLTGTLTGNVTGNVTGNTSGTALTVTQAAQTTITSVGTLTALTTSGNIGLGTATDSWHSSYDAIQGANFSLVNDSAAGASKAVTLAYNAYIDSGNAWTYINADEASNIQQYNGQISFATAAAGSADADITFSTKMTILNDGNVGIGTTSPTVASGLGLVLNGGSAQTRIALKNSTTGDASGDGVQFALVSDDLLIQNRESAGVITFQTGDAERMRLDASGNVGIGTASPISPLHVENGAQSLSHSYAYAAKGISIESDEPMIQLMAEDSGTHGGSVLWRYGANVLAIHANPSTDTLDFVSGVTSANSFDVHSGGNMSGYRRSMSIGADGKVLIGAAEAATVGKAIVMAMVFG